ncbi:ABC transporter permease [Corallococcus coralloides DSM 2259]|uniref:ABC transporter permease n=1 Tax=Corallococcus coralloides (strain ATCC 25202 / DSM 2259 / NBRC 100086 / M2) TaxID=1144275 RepID=H8MWQ0_CORCM|nr:ABC transporter permease [Corallococcus coralloides]AFE09299.1 ABC transporter permease [Corallococcus coralloides DSM 2259]
MEHLLGDLRYAWRSLKNAPGFVAVAVLTLALGIGANSAVFSVVKGVLLTPPPFTQPERLVLLAPNFDAFGLKEVSNSVPEYRDMTTHTRAFSSLAAFRNDDMTLTAEESPRRLRVVVATASFLPTLGVTPVLGRGFTQEEETPGRDQVVILTDTAWRTLYAKDPEVLGRVLRLDGVPRTVVGVLPPGGVYPEDMEAVLPLAPTPEQQEESRRGNRFLNVLARLKPGMTLDTARADLVRMGDARPTDLVSRYREWGWSMSVKPLEDQIVGGVRETLWLLWGAVGFVLLVACSSVANLLLARAVSRGREVSIRAALGAGRLRLVAQFLTESLVLSLVAGAVGLLLALWGTDALVATVGEGLPRAQGVKLDVASVLFTLGVSVLTGVLFGLVPALQASRVDLHAAMREGARATGSHRTGRLRAALVVAQVSLALVLLVGAGLFVRSFLALQRVDAGFAPDGVLTGQLALPKVQYPDPAKQAAFLQALLPRLQALPGVESAGLTNLLPLGGSADRSFDIEGRPRQPGAQWKAVEFRAATPGYLNALRVHLRQGRLLEDSDGPGAPWVVVINRSFADLFWPKGDALGQRVKLHGQDMQWTTVVGIVDDLREWGLDVPSRPAAYYSLSQLPDVSMGLAVRVKSGDPEALRAQVEAEVRAVDADLPLFDVSSLTRRMDQSTGPRRLSALVMGLFAGVALLLAALGLSGVIAFSVSQRTRELGIRMALGAARGDVLRLVLAQGLRLSLTGVAVGLCLSLGLARLLGSLLYGVSADDPWTFGGVALLLTGVALGASWLPARRATRVDPIIALRAD